MARARQRLVSLRRRHGLVIAAYGLAGWALIYPEPYGLCIALLALAALAALAMPRRVGGFFALQPKKETVSASLDISIPLCMVLAIRALVDVDMIDWQGPLLLAGGCGLVFAGLSLTSVPPALRNPGRKGAIGVALSYFLAGLGFGWGASVQADMLLDQSTPITHRLQATEKWVVRGRSTRAHLRLGAPNDLGVDEVHVNDWLYARTPVGAYICVQSHDGALGFRWYRADACATAVAP